VDAPPRHPPRHRTSVHRRRQPDRHIVADVVAEWAERHGRPYRLILDGPAGGTFQYGNAGEAHELDAVEFCRIVSGRAPGTGLLSTGVAF
jgi:hypothetical protein